MIAERAVAIHRLGMERWGRKPPADMSEPMKMLGTLGQQVKPTAELGPTLTDAALAVSRRLRKETS